MTLVEGGLYFDIYGNIVGIVQCTGITEYEYHLVIVKCSDSKFIGLSGTMPVDSDLSLVPLTPLLEALL